MCPSPRRIEIPKDLGWRQEVGPGAIKWLPLPPPRPGTVLGSGKTQKTGGISANNSAAASACAAPASGAAGPRGRSPRCRGARGGWGIPGRRRLPRGALFGQPPRERGAEETWRGKARLTWGPKAPPDSASRLRTRQVSGTAGPGGGRWRGSELGSTSRARGTPLATRPRAACRAVTAPRDPGTLLAAPSVPAGVTALLSRVACSPTGHTLSPRQPCASSSLTLPPVTPPSASSHPPQPTCFCRSLRSELPLPEPPPLLGNPTVSEQRGGPGKHGGWLTLRSSPTSPRPLQSAEPPAC